jgi:hypothetical protein
MREGEKERDTERRKLNTALFTHVNVYINYITSQNIYFYSYNSHNFYIHINIFDYKYDLICFIKKYVSGVQDSVKTYYMNDCRSCLAWHYLITYYGNKSTMVIL